MLTATIKNGVIKFKREKKASQKVLKLVLKTTITFLQFIFLPALKSHLACTYNCIIVAQPPLFDFTFISDAKFRRLIIAFMWTIN